ncbi:dynein light chain Tctex-type protein 2B-like [Sycon ciliatum]|uniref:dynein light chain Tctex-type protein 2B-like n=1 Tax=Sycon ciliatum TaxID=27933 RepID=UPI0020AE3DD8|eukprot:scpid26075/ scgid9018/ Tctex1 domain-containing protein 2
MSASSSDAESSGGSLESSRAAGAAGEADARKVVDDSSTTRNTYTIRPNFHLKFRPAAIKDILRTVLYEELSDKEYTAEDAKEWSQKAADLIRQRLKDLELDRYKYVVQVIVGEQRGQGIKIGSRCLWDSDTDNMAQEAFLGETLFGVAFVFGVFHY